ncbi:MAG: type II toxin-antitoxin system VapC family toxin [Holophagales bacterium]|nr:type II toxin-antitoxin system VapC family toxin [Holophagales bacterium]MYC08706.1 type II toxin-antitoxin system VapC family toxin [Holophagales bacterium]
MNVVDSSGWLEYLADSERADLFEEPILDTSALLVPTICLYEVFRITCRQRSEAEAREAIATMQQGQVVSLSPELALHAAQLSLKHSLPMADALILATAYSGEAKLWTQDVDFEGLPGVRYFPR